ncbi:MAG: excinuclease ABC subunit UvrA [Armatimonadetes bacterium]|nr:excinuclease ABC subunit UvrA [Armatimonadota bacterium]
MSQDKIIIHGARQHNLKDIDLEIPRDKLVVITGLSGSGKSSLAFDTIYAEGQRRYVESLSAYARQFLGQMDKPDVDDIQGLSPAVSIDQKSTTRNPRSTVGTVTEIYDYLRLLFARVGTPHCPKCGQAVAQQTTEQIVDTVLSLPEGSRLQILAPLVRGRKGTYQTVIDDVRQQGYVRVRVDGQMHEVTDDIEMDRYKQHTIEVVIDRIVLRSDAGQRISDSISTALRLAGGNVSVFVQSRKEGDQDGFDEQELTFSEHFACPNCGVSLEEVAPRNFSFNSPYGACPECHGLGAFQKIDADLVIPNKKLSINQGAIAPLARSTSEYWQKVLKGVGEAYGFTMDTPVEDLTAKQFQILLNGSDRQIEIHSESRYGRGSVWQTRFEGVLNWLDRRYRESTSPQLREETERLMTSHPCPSCHGARLKPESLAVTLGDRNISQVTELSVSAALDFFDGLALSERQQIIARQVVKEIKVRLGFLRDVGLTYLTLNRAAGTLAGGEAQRIRLATQIGSGLMGVLYILDEPSIGLHQRDNHRLIETLVRLRDLGNTIIVVEHDEDTMRAADWIIDIGPGAGEHGGFVVSAGPIEEIIRNSESFTGRYLAGVERIEVPVERRSPNGKFVEVKGATQHNLKNIDVRIPLGVFTCVTGVSGSGKSTLIQETLYPRLMREVYGTFRGAGKHREMKGAENVDKVIDINQSPIGRTPRSNPATYTGVFDMIRQLFAQTPDARMRGYKPGRFSFNVKGGRCESCHGDGIIKIEMHFLPDVYIPCEVCKGKRYNRETLEVRYKGKTIADVLDMTVQQALEFFRNIPPIARKLSTIHDVGLDYIKLGQPATQLSGGEAQRVKLATELAKRGTGKTLYILDEPTTGLHFHDIKKLLEVLQRLTSQGNSVLAIEHNLDVIKTADWIIDMGPEGGEQGGTVVALGTPEAVAACEASHTGRFLRPMLDAEKVQQAALNASIDSASENGSGRRRPARKSAVKKVEAAA